MGVPTVPLTELYNRAGRLHDGARRGGALPAAAESFRAEFAEVKLLLPGGEESFDFVILAVPFDVLSQHVARHHGRGAVAADTCRSFETSPITGIHMWFDRQITDLDHAVLLDRTIQWMFHKSKLLVTPGSGTGQWQLCRTGGQLVEDSGGEIAAGNYRSGS